MQILVTGGAGFIGAHLVEGLLAAGHTVRVMDSLVGGDPGHLPSAVELVRLDVREADAARWIEAERPEVIFHLAAQIDVRASVADPLQDAQVNLLGTLRLLSAAAVSGTRRFILASTGGAIYGTQSIFPADEDHPCQPESPYGLSKWCAEVYLAHFGRAAPRLQTLALRFSNVYGPRQNPHGEAGVVAIFIKSMLQRRAPVLYGAGSQTRDFVYVGDVVRANLAALEAPEMAGVVNIGTGNEVRIRDLYARLAALTGYKGKVSTAPLRPGEQARSAIDNGRARSLLGWAPQVSIEAGLRATVRWFSRDLPKGRAEAQTISG